jgi:Transcription elongation factor, GreA/GreB, C-term
MADLLGALARLGIEPLGKSGDGTVYTETRTIPTIASVIKASEPRRDASEKGVVASIKTSIEPTEGIRVGDRVIIRYLDENKTASYTLSNERNDNLNGLLSVRTPLGKHLLGCVEEDEIELEVSGHKRRVLIVRTERPTTTMH